jgi:hypothetical protein
MRPWSSGKRYCIVFRREPTIARPELKTPDAIPESIKATENQQHPCDPVHKRKPDSHNFLFEEVGKLREQDKPGQGTEKDAGH